MKNLLNKLIINKRYQLLVLSLPVFFIILSPTLKQYLNFKPSSVAGNTKDVYSVVLFKTPKQAGISLIVKGRAVPNYNKTGEYELKGLVSDKVVSSIRFNFDDTIVYDPKPECITDSGEIITNTSNCQPFQPVVKLDNVTKLLNLEYIRGMNEIQLYKNAEMLAKRYLDGRIPDTSHDPFVQSESNMDFNVVKDQEAEQLFESVRPTIQHQNLIKAPIGQQVTFVAKVTDSLSEVAQVKLYWAKQLIDGSWTEFYKVLMKKEGNDIYRAILLPEETLDRPLRYYILAEDKTGNTNQTPTITLLRYYIMIIKYKELERAIEVPPPAPPKLQPSPVPLLQP